MARPLQITPAFIAQVVQRRQRGQSAAAVAAALGVSKSSVDRAMKYAKGADPSKPEPREPAPPPAVPPAPDSAPPEAIPEGVSPAQVQAWIADVQRMAADAKARSEVGAFATLTTRYVQLLEHLRKITPAAQPDPNDQPDMIAAAKRARDKLHDLIESAL